MRLKPFKKMKQYIRPPFPLRPVKNHEVGPVVVSRSGNAMRRVGNMYTPRVNGMITSNGSTRNVSVGEERKKMGAVGVVKVAPERIESFVES